MRVGTIQTYEVVGVAQSSPPFLEVTLRACGPAQNHLGTCLLVEAVEVVDLDHVTRWRCSDSTGLADGDKGNALHLLFWHVTSKDHVDYCKFMDCSNCSERKQQS